VTAYLQGLLNFIGLHPNLAIAATFIVSAGEALPIVGLFSPSTLVLVGIGGLEGLGKVSFWPAFIATILGAVIGDGISYWTGRIYKQRLVEIWPFSLGRFIPGIKPVVSGVVGMMGMGALRFTLINILSAIAWAAVHILPGVSAGLALTGLNVISDGLVVVVGMLAIGIALAMWLARGVIGSRLPYLSRLQIALLERANRHADRIGRAIERLAAVKRAVRPSTHFQWKIAELRKIRVLTRTNVALAVTFILGAVSAAQAAGQLYLADIIFNWLNR
jgi:membrane protein DedA with SNARE-associated domain